MIRIQMRFCISTVGPEQESLWAVLGSDGFEGRFAENDIQGLWLEVQSSLQYALGTLCRCTEEKPYAE